MSTESNVTRADHLFASERKVLQFTVTDSAGAAVNITGWTLEWVLSNEPGGTALLTKTTASGITITNGAGGVFTVTLAAADLALNPGVYYYRTWRTDSGAEQSLAFGALTVLAK